MFSKKARISILAALIFFVIANPKTYKVMRDVLGDWVASSTGCPTTKGLILHTLVYLVITYVLMKGSRESLEGEDEVEDEVEVEDEDEGDTEAKNVAEDVAEDEVEEEIVQQPINSSSNKMSSISGANLNESNSGFSSVVETSSAMVDSAQPIATVSAPAPVPSPTNVDMTRVLSGSSWNKCGCEDGGEVLVLK